MYFTYNKLDENDDIDFEMFYGARVNPSLQNMHRALAGPSGKIAFEVDNDGYYTYCVRQNPPLSRPTVCVVLSTCCSNVVVASKPSCSLWP